LLKSVVRFRVYLLAVFVIAKNRAAVGNAVCCRLSLLEMSSQDVGLNLLVGSWMNIVPSATKRTYVSGNKWCNLLRL
jgi:hypothetical protein